MKNLSALLIPLAALTACTNSEPHPSPNQPPVVVVPGEGNTPEYNPAETPSFTYTITPYSGQTATDVPSYPQGNSDLNPDENLWEAVVTVTYSGSTASVAGAEDAGVIARVTGANVDLNLGLSQLVKVVATGSSSNGSLRISGDRKHLLELDNLTLTSTDRPAINDQNKKRVFLKLTGKSAITDGPQYVATAEDRKGCFFAEGHVVLCGSGVLQVEGHYRHGFATDGFLFVNPGASLVVTDAAKNAIHVKGSGVNNEFRGIEITGGYIYANTSAPAGKAMKCDSEIRLRGGRLDLSCSGNPAFDTTDNTLSSSACIKSDAAVYVSGSEISMCATGHGGKGINAEGNVMISGGTTSAAISGDGVEDQGDTSTPKAIVSHQTLSISGGLVCLSAIGHNAAGLEADAEIAIDGGVSYVFGSSFGIKSPKASVNKGILICGGSRNSTIASSNVTLTDYPSVTADEESLLMTDDGSAIRATFRWPVALSPAQLLTAGI